MRWVGAWQGWMGTQPGRDTQPSASSPRTSAKQGTDPLDKEGGDVQELPPQAGIQKQARSAGGKARRTAAEDRASTPAARDHPTPTHTRSTAGFYINLIWHNQLTARICIAATHQECRGYSGNKISFADHNLGGICEQLWLVETREKSFPLMILTFIKLRKIT